MKNELPIQKKKNGGYTIIETMIAVSLFIIIVMAGMGALLSANSLSQKSQNLRSIMDNLNFVMEDMSRNLRIGYDYHCIDGSVNGSSTGTSVYSCPSGEGIYFTRPNEGASPSNLKYYLGNNPTSNSSYSIFRTTGGGAAVQLTPDEILIENPNLVEVFGAEKPPDKQQPFVTIRIKGKIIYKTVETPFSLQTSVSQRQIDI